MYASRGVGLAATQVNVPERVIVMDISPERDSPRCYVNPEIVSAEGQVASEEGCLSVPEFTAEVPRAERVSLRARTVDMELLEEEFDGLAAICVQHEIDHLDGKLFIDYLSPLKRRMLPQARGEERADRQTRGDGAVAPTSLPAPDECACEDCFCRHARFCLGSAYRPARCRVLHTGRHYPTRSGRGPRPQTEGLAGQGMGTERRVAIVAAAPLG